MPLRVSQIMQLQAMCQLADRHRAGQHARDDHHHPVLLRYAIHQSQAGQMLGPRGLADQPVDDGHHRFRCRKQHQQSRQQSPAASAALRGRVVHQHPQHQTRRTHQQTTKIGAQDRALHQDSPSQTCAETCVPLKPKCLQQDRLASATQPMLGH